MRRRTTPRIRVKHVSARVRRRKRLSWGERGEWVRVIDIGPRGMSFFGERGADPDTRLDMDIDLPDRGTLRCTGEVRNSRAVEHGTVVGVEFTKVSPAGRTFLGNSRNLLPLAEMRPPAEEMDLPSRLRWFRNATGMTVVELAEASGISPSDISDIEMGRDDSPHGATLQPLARSMGLTLSDLLVKRPPDPRPPSTTEPSSGPLSGLGSLVPATF